MNTPNAKERGQVIILLVFGMVALLGFTALAIDGGMVYYDRRHAQNAADAAAMAGAFALANNPTGDLAAKRTRITTAALSRAKDNGYENGGNYLVEVDYPPTTGNPYAGDDEYIQVVIHSKVDTSLIHFVYQGEVKNTVEALSHVTAGSVGAPYHGAAIVALAPDGEGMLYISGNSKTTLIGGGAFVNSDDGNALYMKKNPDLTAPYVDIAGCSERKAELDVPSGEVHCGVEQEPYPPEPLFTPAPSCPTNSTGTTTLTPGNVTGSKISGAKTLQAGLYCVTGEIKFNGGENITGIGVTFYMINGGFTYNGNSNIHFEAPSEGTYKGMLFYFKPGNSSAVKINGTTSPTFSGTIYAPNSEITLTGTGNTSGTCNLAGSFCSQVIGYRVILNGDSESIITYDKDKNYQEKKSATVDLTQ